jgi:FkbM family methyltransferase
LCNKILKMIAFLRNSFLEKLIKSNIYLLYYSNFVIKFFSFFLLPLEDDWKGFKKIKIKKNQKILDIGAHWGESYTIFRKYFDNPIYCYEPNPNSFGYLKKRTQKDSKTKIYNYGINPKNMKKKLYFPSCGNNELTLWGNDNFSNLKKRLATHTYLNIKNLNFISKNCFFKKIPNLINVGIIKIDVEGAELKVLKSIKKKILYNAKVIFIEFNENNFKKVISFLSKFNFYPYIYVNNINSFLKITSNKDINKLKKIKTAVNIFFQKKN